MPEDLAEFVKVAQPRQEIVRRECMPEQVGVQPVDAGAPLQPFKNSLYQINR